ncbi:phosphonatase-like hydrolase [Leifsonia sp. NPDC056824]|uniref:phosphonatase-like hydrolase n=1 Tax=Leifsonia sp. NPDC056824 TaxID=3345953 RepID=UPI003676CB6A
MSPEGLITSEFDDAAIIDTEVDAAAVVAVDADDPDAIDHDELADLELVVLDLAGTTVVDDGLVEHAFLRAVDAAGLAVTDDEQRRAWAFVRDTMGQPKLAVFRALTDDEDQAEHANAVFESAYAELAADQGLRPVPGAEDLIRRLQSLGVAVVLTTGFSRTTQDAVLAALGWRDLADLTLSASDARRGRPYPDLPLTALLRTGASSVEGMVVVGDTASDIVSGLSAGAGLVVGVLTGAHDEETLTAAGADAVIASVADLAELLGLDELERADELDDEFDDLDELDFDDDPDGEPDDRDARDEDDEDDLDDLADAADQDDRDATSPIPAAPKAALRAVDRPEGQTRR